MNTKELVKNLEKHLYIPSNHHIIAVFDNNNSVEIKGFIVAENGKEGSYPLLSLEDLIDIYG